VLHETRDVIKATKHCILFASCRSCESLFEAGDDCNAGSCTLLLCKQASIAMSSSFLHKTVLGQTEGLARYAAIVCRTNLQIWLHSPRTSAALLVTGTYTFRARRSLLLSVKQRAVLQDTALAFYSSFAKLRTIPSRTRKQRRQGKVGRRGTPKQQILSRATKQA
jgi:hypothetical protein